MAIDNKTAKRIERAWVANQPLSALLPLDRESPPTRFSHFAWLRSNRIARYWWALPYALGGGALFTVLIHLGLAEQAEMSPATLNLLANFGRLVGISVGLYVGWRLHGRTATKS